LKDDYYNITRDFIGETIKKKILTLYINRYIGRWIQCKFNFVNSDARACGTRCDGIPLQSSIA